MPYNGAINDYSRGVRQLPPASYQPYPRSTAVSLGEHNVPIGIAGGCFLPGASLWLSQPAYSFSFHPLKKVLNCSFKKQNKTMDTAEIEMHAKMNEWISV